MTTPTVPGLLLEGAWIPPVRLYGGATKSLVDIVCSQRDNIFPGYYVSTFDLSFAQDLEDPLNVDLVLISSNYKAWYLLLVEPSRDADVDSLVANLQTMELHGFGGREARYLQRQIKELDGDRLALLVNDSPRFLVVTDDPRTRWSERFAEANLGANVMIIEPFRYANKYVLRINGKSPSYSVDTVVGTCEEHPTLPRCLVLRWHGSLPAPTPGDLEIGYGNDMTEWELLQGNPELLLIPAGSFALQEQPPFDLICEMDGTFSLSKS